MRATIAVFVALLLIYVCTVAAVEVEVNPDTPDGAPEVESEPREREESKAVYVPRVVVSGVLGLLVAVVVIIGVGGWWFVRKRRARAPMPPVAPAAENEVVP